MAFDIGFNFRETSGYVTDQTYAVPVLAEAYPHTYTNVDGYSISAGWTQGPQGTGDRSATNDPRIAGLNYHANNGTGGIFRVDLGSGSAPGAGDYMVDVALGSATQALTQLAKVQDNSSDVLDLTNGGAGFSPGSGHYIDATGADIAATTTWTGTPVALTFATTTVFFKIGFINVGSFSALAHFRLTLASSQSVVPVLMAQYRQRR